MQKHTYPNIPGLIFYEDYFSQEECSQLVDRSMTLCQELEVAISDSSKIEKAHIPQPEFVRSAKHNLASEEFYTRIRLVQSNQRIASCEYFPRYGEDGHALCYFRGTSNLPDFVCEGLLDRIGESIQKESFIREGQELTWKLTMNFYKNVGGTIAGFPFHVDIPANGVVTMILNIQREVLFQIAKEDFVQDIELPIGSILLLSGESRYEWKHRVLPRVAGHSETPNKVERVSLVLGFQ